MKFFVYNLISLLLLPFILIYFICRMFSKKRNPAAWPNQLGFTKTTAKDPKVWIHAVSVGESVAGASMVAALKKIADVSVVFSTTTKNGQDMAKNTVKETSDFIYFPIDYFLCVWQALLRVRPVAFACVDTEIWPNFFTLAHMMGVKVAMINGTISDRTWRGARIVPWVYRMALENADLLCMQSYNDARRVIALGAKPELVFVTGNLKADQFTEHASPDEMAELRRNFGVKAGQKVFVAGSTNPGEDQPVVEAFAAARKVFPDMKLIIAPRQINRADEIEAIAADFGFTCGRRSDGTAADEARDIAVLDTFGELARVYELCDISFVGGSLIPKGCHSILQPISLGKGVFFGPYTFKAKALVTQAKRFGAGFEVSGGSHLGEKLIAFLSDSKKMASIAKGCKDMMEENIGAADRTAAKFAELLPKEENK